MSQLALEIPVSVDCKVRGCPDPVVGSSITGDGHVCKAHNEAEWHTRLTSSKHAHVREMGALLARDIDRKERR